MAEKAHFAGSTSLSGKSCADVWVDGPRSTPNSQKFTIGGGQGRDFDVLRVPGHPEPGESAASSTIKCVTLATQRQRDVSLRVVGIKLDAEGWVKNVLIPALVEKFIDENGDPR